MKTFETNEFKKVYFFLRYELELDLNFQLGFPTADLSRSRDSSWENNTKKKILKQEKKKSIKLRLITRGENQSRITGLKLIVSCFASEFSPSIFYSWTLPRKKKIFSHFQSFQDDFLSVPDFPETLGKFLSELSGKRVARG